VRPSTMPRTFLFLLSGCCGAHHHRRCCSRQMWDALKFCSCGVTSAIAEAPKRGLGSPSIPLVESSWSEDGSASTESMHLLGEGLRATTLFFLETLHLSQAVAENDVLSVLANSLSVNSSLTTLNVFGCAFSDDLVALLTDSVLPSIQQMPCCGDARCLQLPRVQRLLDGQALALPAATGQRRGRKEWMSQL
jgi:hypothetical protein